MVVGVLLVAGLVHGVNMLDFPFYESDEGTYLSQAWAVVKLGRLAPYTYTYDHAPLGWIQLAGWSVLSGGFAAWGSAVAGGRVLMLLLQVASTYLVYWVTRRVANSVLAGLLAALAFAISAYGLYYHRRVLLDNLSAFWMLLSLALVIGAGRAGWRLWLSALALGVSILSKEVTAAAVPGLAWLVFVTTKGPRRWGRTLGWTVLVGTVVATYPLLALARGDLLAGQPGAAASGVSLLESLQWQLGRGRDGGLLEPGSRFWLATLDWARSEPLLVVGGGIATVLALLQCRCRPVASAIGLVSLSLWLFLARGGEVFAFYLLPLLPLLAISTGQAGADLADWLARSWRGNRARVGLRCRLARVLVLVLALGLTGLGYRSPALGFQNDPWTPWQNRQAVAQRAAIDWIRQNALPDSRLVIDPALWTDLHTGPDRATAFPNAHAYWKVERDPAIRSGVFRDDWRQVEYLVTSPQLLQDVRSADMSLVAAALERSETVARFDSGGWPVEIRKVNRLRG
jgi:hypothetical protein